MARKGEPADSPKGEQPVVTEDLVVAYLKANPDFLSRQPDLIARMAQPTRFDGGSVVDLQQFMIGRLHDELDQMRGCAEHLITTSRSNMSIQSRTIEAVLTTMDAADMEGLSQVMSEDYPALLDVDVCCLGFETGEHPAILPGVHPLPPGLLDQVIGPNEVMLRGHANGDPVIFGDAASLVCSFALVRLDPPGCPPGLLALGSRNERTFHTSQGTELLAFLARVLEDCISRWWPQTE